MSRSSSRRNKSLLVPVDDTDVGAEYNLAEYRRIPKRRTQIRRTQQAVAGTSRPPKRGSLPTPTSSSSAKCITEDPTTLLEIPLMEDQAFFNYPQMPARQRKVCTPTRSC